MRDKVTVRHITKRPPGSTPLTMITAYDYTAAMLADAAGVECPGAADCATRMPVAALRSLARVSQAVLPHEKATRGYMEGGPSQLQPSVPSSSRNGCGFPRTLERSC